MRQTYCPYSTAEKPCIIHKPHPQEGNIFTCNHFLWERKCGEWRVKEISARVQYRIIVEYFATVIEKLCEVAGYKSPKDKIFDLNVKIEKLEKELALKNELPLEGENK